MSAGLEILTILLLALFNGLLSMSEIAIVSARKVRLRQRAEDGDRGARAALELAGEPGRFLSTVQIGITLVGIVAGVFGGATLADRLSLLLARWPPLGPHADTVAVALVVLAITYRLLEAWVADIDHVAPQAAGGAPHPTVHNAVRAGVGPRTRPKRG